MKKTNSYNFFYTGGGTLGSVSPLLSISQYFRKKYPNSKHFFLGTKHGPENNIINKDIFFYYNLPAGKLRRYFSIQNLIDPIKIIFAFFKCFFIFLKIHPSAIIGASSFLIVPAFWAGRILGIPTFNLQQDVSTSLSTKLTSPVTSKIFVAYKQILKNFEPGKYSYTGNPVRQEIINGNKEIAIEKYNLSPDLPIVLIMGGGTGSLPINNLVKKSISRLTNNAQIIHITGINKSTIKNSIKNYHQINLTKKYFPHILAASNIVVSRAGTGSLNELAATAKPAIIIPIPKTQQVANADLFSKEHAIESLDESKLDPQTFSDSINSLLQDTAKQEQLSQNIRKLYQPDSLLKITKIIETYL